MTCWSCGGGIPEGSNFCGLCGARQNPTDRVTRSGWMRARDARLALPSAPPPATEPEEGRVTLINPAVMVEGPPEAVALVLPESAHHGEPRPRFAALAAVARPVLLDRLPDPTPGGPDPPEMPSESAPIAHEGWEAPAFEAPAETSPSVAEAPAEGLDEAPPGGDAAADTHLDVPALPEAPLRFEDRPPEAPRARPPVGLIVAAAAALGLVLWWLL